MKRLFTLCMSFLLLGAVASAQEVDPTFQFVDAQGNVVPDGSTIVVNTINAEGQMIVPLFVKNASGAKAAVSMYETINAMPNGGWQTCAFGNCMQLTASGYSPKSIVEADYNQSIETEWIPTAGQYATWEATLQIHVFNIDTKTVFGTTQEQAGSTIIGYGPKVTVRFEYKAPTLIMGSYTSDDVAIGANQGSGFGRYATGKLGVFNVLPKDEISAFDGGKIVKMRVGLAVETTISRLIIYPLTSGSIGDALLDEAVSGNQAGWNEFELTNPLTIDLSSIDALIVGFEYEQTATAYPLSVLEGSHQFLVYGNLGSGVGFYNAGGGDLSVQCYVESDNFPKQDIIALGLMSNKSWYKAGESITYAIDVQNFGIADVNNFVFNVEVDDAVVGTLTSNEVIASQATNTINGTFQLANNMTLGEHKLALRLQSVDGAAPAGNLDDDYISITFNVYEQSVARQKNLLEQFTSQYCTYCPRGVTFFSDLIAQRNDIAWVSVHGNMSGGTDIYTIAAGDTINYYEGVTGFPSASFNRTFIPDLAESSDEIAYGLGYSMNYRTQVVQMFSDAVDYTAQAPSFVTLNVSQKYNAETRQLDITVDGAGAAQAALLLANYGVNVMLTENSLVARQLNEGTWVQEFEHHYVLRAVLGKCTGNSIQWNGDNFTAKFSYTIPEAYNKDNMYVVAFVAPMVDFYDPDTRNMAVNNCEMVAVKDAEAASIRNITTESGVQSHYSLDGRQLPAAQKGLNIIRMADGSVKKVVVK